MARNCHQIPQPVGYIQNEISCFCFLKGLLGKSEHRFLETADKFESFFSRLYQLETVL